MVGLILAGGQLFGCDRSGDHCSRVRRLVSRDPIDSSKPSRPGSVGKVADERKRGSFANAD